MYKKHTHHILKVKSDLMVNLLTIQQPVSQFNLSFLLKPNEWYMGFKLCNIFTYIQTINLKNRRSLCL